MFKTPPKEAKAKRIETEAERLYLRDNPSGNWRGAAKFIRDDYRDQVDRAPR